MDANRISLLRRSDDVGDVHVHFPAVGSSALRSINRRFNVANAAAWVFEL